MYGGNPQAPERILQLSRPSKIKHPQSHETMEFLFSRTFTLNSETL